MVVVKNFENGFEYLEVKNESASAKIALQGAHLFEYCKKNGDSFLWLSPESKFEEGTAIRGGIPLCWPRFGSLDTSLPQHGFARVAMFKLVKVEELTAHVTEITLHLEDDEKSRAIWDYKFLLECKMTIAENFQIELTTCNKDRREFIITEAFHTYFIVNNIDDVVIEALEGIEFIDTLIDKRMREHKVIVIDKEIDRVYQGVEKDILLRDKAKSIKLTTRGSASAIVWNPWIEKCSKMSYMDKNAYKKFVCVESANAFDDFQTIKSGKSHTLSLTISF